MRPLSSLAAVAVAVVVAVLASACNVSPSVATVNGTSVSQSTFDGELATLSASPAAQCALELQGATLPTIAGAGQSSVTSSFAAGELSSVIEQVLVSQALARRHARLTAADLGAARSDVVTELYPPSPSQPSPCGLEGPQLMAKLPASFVNEQVRFQAEAELLLTLVAHVGVGPAAILKYYFTHASQFRQDCLSAIVVSSQAAAAAVRAKVVSGAESFAAAARASSLDPVSRAKGGAIGCPLVSAITNPSLTSVLAGLKPGQVSQPLSESVSGGTPEWVLIEVTSRPEEPLTTVAGTIRREILASHGSALQAELARLVKSAHVHVDPQYGRWTGQAGVVPPVAPPSRFVLSPGADQASSGPASSSVLGPASGYPGPSSPSGAGGSGAGGSGSGG